MIPIICKTNLDLMPAERWPDKLPEVPRVGDYVESSHVWKRPDAGIDCSLELVVVSIRWKVTSQIRKEGFTVLQRIPEVELHLPPSRYENITTFYEWYGRITGKGKHYFI